LSFFKRKTMVMFWTRNLVKVNELNTVTS